MPEQKQDLPTELQYEWPTLPYLQDVDWLNDLIWNGVESLFSSSGSSSSIPNIEAHIPMCDTVKVYVQQAPTISKSSAPTFVSAGSSAHIRVNYTYDTTYSKAAVNSNPVTFTWIFDNIDYPSTPNQVVSTTTPYVNFSPTTKGEHKVTARINDGSFTNSTQIGYIMFAGGNDNTCTPGDCGQIY
ncbi:hypothetical protein SAMN05216262_108141 [Colwellia chukchiensis]|uniref:PKD domain-containing protein n=1 Tax=Colwellia chukchiensis TaxID=641665 RepID=A0A1H7P0I0_9GAMM|nr:hypothetical protein [Colwellia chukchiensis]SEL28984.1 hypothetical protein SAMN05216262_108141 [Colwellia chukchiensis]